MQFNEAVVATFVPVAFFLAAAAILFVVLYFRNRAVQLRHQERMAALEKGIDLPPEPASTDRHAYLLRGLIWLAVGFGITVFFFTFFWAEKDRDLLAPTALGLIPMGVGAAYLVVYRLQGREQPRQA